MHFRKYPLKARSTRLSSALTLPHHASRAHTFAPRSPHCLNNNPLNHRYLSRASSHHLPRALFRIFQLFFPYFPAVFNCFFRTLYFFLHIIFTLRVSSFSFPLSGRGSVRTRESFLCAFTGFLPPEGQRLQGGYIADTFPFLSTLYLLFRLCFSA